MMKWVCGHTAHGMCSRCHSVLAWKAHLLIEVATDAIEALEPHNVPAYEKLRQRLLAAVEYKGNDPR